MNPGDSAPLIALAELGIETHMKPDLIIIAEALGISTRLADYASHDVRVTR